MAAVLGLAFVVAACGGAPATPTTTAPVSVAPAPSLSPSESPGASPGESPGASPGQSPGASASPADHAGTSASPVATVAIDPALAALLPATVSGLDVVRASPTEEAARTSPRLADSVDAFAAVQVFAKSGTDLAIASLVRLRPDASESTFYADWRPSFDEAACAPAGGVSSRETLMIGARSVDATHCVQGATIYHLWLQDGRVLVSVLDVGTTGLGRSLVAGAKG